MLSTLRRLWGQVSEARDREEARRREREDAEAVTTAHFANAALVRGLPVGVGPLTPAQAGGRAVSLRFVSRGGKLEHSAKGPFFGSLVRHR